MTVRRGISKRSHKKIGDCEQSILEYAVQVWQDIPAHLSDAIESIQRRALRVIFPNSSYQQALDQANLISLADYRIFICKKLIVDMRNESHPIPFLALQVMTRSIPYQLRSGNTKTTTTMKRTKRANDFLLLGFLDSNYYCYA